MKRIEFFGVPGVGKTATYRALKSLRNSKREWLLFSEAKRVSVNNYICQNKGLNNKQRLVSLIQRLFINVPVAETIIGVGEGKYLAKRNDQGQFMRFAEEYDTFISNCAEGLLHTNRAAYRRLLGAHLLINTVNDISFLDQHLDDIKVVFDESITQKVFGVIDIEASDCKEKAYNYFISMPEPQGVVVFEGDSMTIDKRLKQRYLEEGKLVPAHRNMDNYTNWIESASEIVKVGKRVFCEKEVKMLELSAKASVHENAKLIREFVLKV